MLDRELAFNQAEISKKLVKDKILIPLIKGACLSEGIVISRAQNTKAQIDVQTLRLILTFSAYSFEHRFATFIF